MVDYTKYSGNVDFLGQYTFTSNSKTVSVIGGIISVASVVEPSPDALYGKIYMKSGTLYFKNSSGTEFDLTAGGVIGSSTVSGLGSVGQITFWSGTSTLAGSGALIWDNINEKLVIQGSLEASESVITI